MKKKILYIDMDGVVANFDKAIMKTYPDINNEKIGWAVRHIKVLKVCKNTNDFFLGLEPIKDSIEAVNKLFESNKYEIYFLSTPMWNYPESFTQKRLWLTKYFGAKVRKRLILTYRKDLNLGDYLIDDTTNNGAGAFSGEHIHFGTEKYPTWKEVLNKLID